MNLKRIFAMIMSISLLAAVPVYAAEPDAEGNSDTPIYLDPSYSFEERAADLVSRMTLEEKISQIGHNAPEISRLGVSKYYYWREGLHGVARQGQATSFPSPFAMSNTWNPELLYTMGDITSTEARIKNSRYDLSYWSPTVNMARDPRWGRNEECFGEDPYLAGQLGAQFVSGMQGDDEKYLKVIATPKHFAANNNETNRRGGTSSVSEFNFRNYYTRVFQNITEQVMPASVMASYNGTTVYRNGSILSSSTGQKINFVPSAANSYLLQDILRRNWGFDGYVTSDCGAGEDLSSSSSGKSPYKKALLGSDKLTPDAYIAEAFKSGLNVECSLGGGNFSQQYGVQAVQNGHITEQEIERAVYELFLQRFKTGEFDDNVAYRNTDSGKLESSNHIAAAEAAAEESWVLLKNEDSILPLKESDKKIVLVGPRAASIILGDYSGAPVNTVSPAEGIKTEVEKKYPGSAVTYIDGVPASTELLNIKSINVDGKAVDLSKAEIKGATLDGGVIKGVTKNTVISVANINFKNNSKINVEMAGITSPGANINVHFGQSGPIGATLKWDTAKNVGEYATYSAGWEGGAGGYTGTETMELTIEANPIKLDINRYKTELDSADVIIAYAGTMWGKDGDSAENKDRTNIELPSSESDVLTLTNAYPEKTVVAMQTVGQINIEPFMNKCKAILWTSYNGQTQGTALGKVLSGETNPSGRLTTTWYKNSDLSKMERASTKDQTIDGITGKYTDYNLQATSSMPGRTYQYYTETPVYPFGHGLSYTNFEYSNMTVDNSSADANGTVKFTVNVKNTGSAAGKEVVQLYVSHPGAGTGNMPIKQLKGFKKTALLQPGETETVEITLNIRDMYLFDEASQKDIVPAGTYTAYLAKNASDVSLSKTFNVTGTLSSTLKTVKAIPDGITLGGLICEDGTALEAVTKINANLSAVMSDEVFCDMSTADVKYTSSNTNVATVDQNGTVSSGAQEGVATITATVTVNGVEKSTSFPVVNTLEIKPNSTDIENALAQLKAAYDALPKEAYSAANLAEINKIYGHGVDGINGAKTKSELETVLAQKINNMNSVVMDNLKEDYIISSVNPEYIKNGVIDYREGGIPLYNGASGTVTNSAPHGGIMLQAVGGDGNRIDNSKLVWQIKKLDNSARKVADINSETGELTVYGNGIIQIIAANVEDLTCGTLMVQVNMQIEGEYADETNGADASDSQSGSSGGHDMGSTGDAWIEYKSVKLSNLESMTIRYAGKNAGTINVSLTKGNDPSNYIATYSLPATGGWSTWAETELTLNNEVLNSAALGGAFDAYGCATIYIQTNGTNLDYFRMSYTENNDAIPYIIEKVLNKADGGLKATVKYRGSTLPKEVPLIAAAYSSADKLKKLVRTDINGSGSYDVALGAADGDTIKLFIWNSLNSIKPLANAYSGTYRTPVDSEIVVYTLDSKEFDYTPLSGGSDSTKFADTINGLGGYGAWTVKGKSASYTYIDVNEKEHSYSFTKAWQAGAGSETNRSLFFTPKSPCKVTAFFNGGTGRDMYISQNGVQLATGLGNGTDTAFSAEITDTSSPVYVYGGSQNKQLIAIIVEYYGTAAVSSVADSEDFDRAMQYTKWNGSDVVLTKNDLTGETKVWTIGAGNLKTQLSTEYFYESDVPYNYDDKYAINRLAEYKGRLYAGCDNGLVIVFTDCFKCYKLKKAADIDIKEMKIKGDTMYISNGQTDIEIKMSDIGGDFIEADEAMAMAENGAVLIDVRSAEEFAEKSFDGSVNIPVDNIESELENYNKATTLIFFCRSGSRAATALEIAKDMGFENVYNLGSIDSLV